MKMVQPLPTRVSLFVETFGDAHDGIPLLVLHGGPSWSHDYLNPGLTRIGRGRRVIAPDMRGCGRSSRDLPLEQYQPELAVEDLICLMDALEIARFDVLGFSTGGQWAQLMVERVPQRVRRLVLASTTAYADFDPELDAWPELQRRRALAPVMPEAGDDLQRTIAWAMNDAPLAIWDLQRLDEYRAFLRDTTQFSGDWLAPFERGLLHRGRPADPASVLNAFAGEVLILHARQDMGFPVSVAERLHEAVPATKLVLLDDCGHQAPFEQPEPWARAVTGFLDEPSATHGVSVEEARATRDRAGILMAAIRGVIRPEQAERELSAFPSDSEPLVELRWADLLARVDEARASGDAAALVGWADLLEMRDDVSCGQGSLGRPDHEEDEGLRDALHRLATPALFGGIDQVLSEF